MSKRIALVVVVAFASSCVTATASAPDRAASATAAIAVGGGFVAAGSLTLVGAGVGGVFAAAAPDDARNALLLEVAGGALIGLLEAGAGGLVIRSNMSLLSTALDDEAKTRAAVDAMILKQVSETRAQCAKKSAPPAAPSNADGAKPDDAKPADADAVPP